MALALSLAEQPSRQVGLTLTQFLPAAIPTLELQKFKMVVVVRADLGMSPGKIAAQCVHAALAAYRQGVVQALPWVREWERQGEATICLQCGSDAELQVCG